VQSIELSGAAWRKSSRTNGGDDQTNCVEVAELPDRIAMRDSKDPTGPALAFTHPEWQAFVGGIRTSQFD
jgi:uncharacterized protein DUF397